MTRKTDVAVAVCAIAFVAVLVVSAIGDRSIRALHVFESVPYVLAAVLAMRRVRTGYALGLVGGAFWLWTAGFLTSFVRNGFERLDMLVRSGAVDRPDILLAVPAAVATAGLAVASAIAYAQLPGKRWRDIAVLATTLVLVPAYFIAIFAIFTPQYLEIYRRLIR